LQEGFPNTQRKERAVTHKGHVKNGMVVLDEPVKLPEGQRVSVRVMRGGGKRARKKNALPTLYEQLKPVIGIAKGLPSDLAENHDHYLHGRSKVSK
jgi:hypothetical protein